MTRSEISEFFAKRNQAWQDHDAEALATGHAEDGAIESPLWGNINGRSAIHKSYAEWYTIFPDAEYHEEYLLIDGDQAAQFVKISGTQQRDLCGFPATGKRMQFLEVSLYFFSEGTISREIRTYDFTGFLVQLGALKARPAF